MTDDLYDVAIVGGGPAGTVAALTLARLGLAVVVVEQSRYENARPGEALPPAARPLLRRLELDEEIASVAAPSYGNESAWGSAEILAEPFVLDPRGPGRHVDRQKLDALLARKATEAGAALRIGAALGSCDMARDGFRLTIEGEGDLTARAAIDATGRKASLARRLGGRRIVVDHLVGVVARYRGRPHDGGPTFVEAMPAGWYYSAFVPPDVTVVGFMTDPDLWGSMRRLGRSWDDLLTGTATAARVADSVRTSEPDVVSAISHRLARGDRDGRWLAAGDAAMAVDPLSASGLLRAMTTGRAAAMAIAHSLLGRTAPARDYERWLDAEFERYSAQRATYYARETRWPGEPFWRRRHPA